MPLLNIQQIHHQTWLGLWAVSESSEEILSRFPILKNEYEDACLRFANEGKRRERMCVRALMVEMNHGQTVDICYNTDGKPMLGDGRRISISHTKGVVAVIVSEKQTVGVDVEYYSDRVRKVAAKFVRQDEWTDDVNALLIIWSAKEAVYKLFSEDHLWFDEMRTAPFDTQRDGEIRVENLKRNTSVCVHYKFENEYVLTYVVL